MRRPGVANQELNNAGGVRRALLAALLSLAAAGAGPAPGSSPGRSPSPATGQAPLAASPADILARIFTVQPAKAEWFAPAFLAKVPVDQVNAVLDSVRQQFGTFVRSTPEGRLYLVHLANGDVRVLIRLDANGLINTLLIRPASAG